MEARHIIPASMVEVVGSLGFEPGTNRLVVSHFWLDPLSAMDLLSNTLEIARWIIANWFWGWIGF
jgi:hypothetical protein